MENQNQKGLFLKLGTSLFDFDFDLFQSTYRNKSLNKTEL